MLQAANACHANNRERFVSPRQHVTSLIGALTEPHVVLHPVHGLFENSTQGYRAEYKTTPPQATQTSMKNTTASFAIYLYNTTQHFLNNNEQGLLFITVELSTLLQHSCIALLTTLIQSTPTLSNRLVLLLQQNDLYPDSANERSIELVSKQLSNTGIQLGIETTNSRTLTHCNYLKFLASPCMLINYCDDWMHQQLNMHELCAIIRHCRINRWPLLVDHRPTNSRSIS